MRGQIAIEYMGILIIAITIFLATFYIATKSLSERKQTLSLVQAQVSVNDIATAVNILCNKPEDSTLIVYEKIPDYTSLPDSGVGQRRIYLTLITDQMNQTVYSDVDCSVNGTLPNNTGSFQFKVTKNTGNVTVSYL